MSKNTMTCPRCNDREFTIHGVELQPGMPPYAAVSRVDNRTLICSECGTSEALQDYLRETQDQWGSDNE